MVPVPPSHDRAHPVNRFRHTPPHSRIDIQEAALRQRERIFGDLQIEVLGRGTFGTVFSSSKPDVCVKCFERNEDYGSESAVARHLRGLEKWPTNLVKVFVPQLFEPPLDMDGVVYIGYVPMERLGHDLNFIEQYTVSQTNQVFRDIGTALCYLSDVGLVHTDVKTQNILCYNQDDHLRMKLGDIAGVTIILQCRWKKFRGTAACASPSMLSNFQYHKKENIPERILRLLPIVNSFPEKLFPKSSKFLLVEDMWQFGMVLLEMCSKEFRALNGKKVGWWTQYSKAIEEGEGIENLLKDYIVCSPYKPHVKDILNEMLQFDPEERLQFPTLKIHLQRVYID